MPYQLNKARLIERIAELVKEKKHRGHHRAARRVRQGRPARGDRAAPRRVGEVVLNNLYAQTQLQTVFGINMVALVDGQPRTLNLKEMLEAFVRHRREVVTRRTVYLLRKARERGHVLEGLAIALANIDQVIELIKALAQLHRGARNAAGGARWEPGDGAGDARTRRRRCLPPRGPDARVRAARRPLPPVAGTGPGDPRPAPAPPDRPRAREAARGVPGEARRDRGLPARSSAIRCA